MDQLVDGPARPIDLSRLDSTLGYGAHDAATLAAGTAVGTLEPPLPVDLPLAAPGRRRGSRRLLADRHQRYTFLALVAAWLLGTTLFLRWLWAGAHLASVGGTVVTSALILLEIVILPGWFFFFSWRARRPTVPDSIPDLRVAMVVTKAPSEPWPLVQTTLEGMLTQDFPKPYDVWLADESPSDDAREWCRRQGVRIITRRGVKVYHREEWPRRRACKEGNLSFFYDSIGYVLYDVVVQLDADHVPEVDYLRHMVEPFADPRIGYVAAPSICDRNAKRSWSARGRLFQEAVLHGAHQAGCGDGWAPSCIGSHYAVRTKALEQIGGLGPELAEDFSTTMLMTAGGWEGAFAIDAEAHGDGPASLADALRQELQWSRSMMNIMLSYAPRWWRSLPWRPRLRFAFCLAWYPLFGLSMLAAILLPDFALITHQPLLRVDLGSFFLRMAPILVALGGTTAWLRAQGLLRPADARLFTWEAILFQLVRWPWALIGCLQALAERARLHRFEFLVTPKRPGLRPLPGHVLIPYAVVALLSLLPAVAFSGGGAARGYFFWSIADGALYVGVCIAVVALHVSENRHYGIGPAARTVLSRLPLILAGVVLLALALTRHGSDALLGFKRGGSQPTVPPAAHVPSRPVAAVTGAPVRLGVSTEGLAGNEARTWDASDLAQVGSFEHAVGRHAGVVMWFADFTDAPDLDQLRAVQARGSVPEITWEPWDHRPGVDRRRYALRQIAAGRFDSYVREWADALARYGGPVRLRFAQEMNGHVYPWAVNSAGFVAAWRHIHDIFTAAGASNVRWVWAPLSGKINFALYPGDRYVDVLGISGFNGGSQLHWYGWRSFAQIFEDDLNDLHRFAPDKPLEISETSSVERGGSKAAWIAGMFATLRRHPEVTVVNWFDVVKEADWRVESSLGAARAMATALRDPRFGPTDPASR